MTKKFLGAACAALFLVACGGDNAGQDVGSAAVSVRSSAIHTATGDTVVTLRAFNGAGKTWGSANPFFDAAIDGGNSLWSKTFDNLAAGEYTFCARAVEDSTVFGPGCTSTTVKKNTVAVIDLILQQAGNDGSTTLDSPLISGISLSDGAPHYGEQVEMSVSVVDTNGAPLTYAWTATCSAGAASIGFAPANGASTTLTTDCQGTASITITVSDGSIVSSVTFPLVFAPQGAEARVSLNMFPALGRFSVSQGQLAFGGKSVITLPASDDETLTYSWNSCAGGSFLAPVTSEGTNEFTAPSVAGDCRVTVVVTDGIGGKSTASVTLHVGNAVAVTQPVFNNLPEVMPGNVPSLGFQATQTAEFGDYITLAGTGRHLTKATVLMSAWAKHSDWPSVGTSEGFEHPITINIYAPSDLTTPIGTKTQTFVIPWRPEAAGGACGGAWQASDGSCYNGFAFTITFDLSGLGIVVPDSFSYGIAYNTQTWGANPIGVDGPYTSLNVGTVSAAPSVGIDPNPDAVLWNTSTAGWYADNGAGGVGTFRTDTAWTGYAPAVEFFAY
jgi:hypothetical protein